MSSCFPSGYSTTGTYQLTADCYVPGNLGLEGNGSLTMTNGILTIYGDLVLMNNALLNIVDGGIKFPQNGYSEYGIFMQNAAILCLVNSTFVTNNSTEDNFSMSLSAYDDALTIFANSTLNTESGSWLLGNYSQNSRLQMIGSLNLPTEVYPSDSSSVSMTEYSNFAGVWLIFDEGSDAAVEVPLLNPDGFYNFSFGTSIGFEYSVTIKNSYCRLGFNSFPGSTMVITSDGTSTGKVPLVFGYYIVSNTLPVIVSNLTVGNNISALYTDSGRILQLQNVYLNPFSWQVYASNTTEHNVVIKDSLINEVASFSGANMSIVNCVLQLAVCEAGGSGAILSIVNSQIWSQSIQAASGGIIYITGSDIHGNYVNADGSGSLVEFSNSTFDLRNGNSSILNCNADAVGYTPNIGGVPLCNPFTPLHQCAQVSASEGGAYVKAPLCLSYPSESPTPSTHPSNPSITRPPTVAPIAYPSNISHSTMEPTFMPLTLMPSIGTKSSASATGGEPLNGVAVAGVACGVAAAVAVLLACTAFVRWRLSKKAADSPTNEVLLRAGDDGRL